MRLLAGVVATFVVGAVSGAAGVLIHQTWWGLALALAAALVALAWLPPGMVRLAFVVGWSVPVVRGAIALPSGDYLIASNAAGWSFLAGTVVLVVAALVTVRPGSGRAGDHEVRGPAT